MRILIANWHRNVTGGAEKYLQALLPALRARGHEIAIAYENPVDPRRETLDPPDLPLPGWGVAELGATETLKRIAEWKPDVAYVHGLEDGGLEDALQRRYRAVLFSHNYYGTCGTGSKYHGFPSPRPCGRRFGPACVALHYPRRCGGLNPFQTWRLFRHQWQRHEALPRYSAILVASNHMYHEFLQHGLAASKVHLVPLPGTGVGLPAPPSANRSPQGRILLISRLTDVKGGGHLIQAIRKASEQIGPLSLTIAGDGPKRQDLEDLARQCRVKTHFAGWVETAEKLRLIREADLIAVPSLWPEPFGLIGIEAGGWGVPAVGFAVGGIPDWLVAGYSGELAPGDPPAVEGLAQAIIRVLTDPEHYRTLCRGAWETARRFTMEAHLAKLEPILGVDENQPLSIQQGISSVAD
jgi:glycosyltransferase involved in cell wall biosynthesis